MERTPVAATKWCARTTVPVSSVDRPQRGPLVVVGRRDAGAEAHVAPEVEPVHHVVQVALDLGLLGEVLLPFPLLEQLPREEVGVGVALRVEARARVAVPVPGAADAVARLEQLHGEAGFPCQVELVDTGDAPADDEHVDVGGRPARRLVRCGFGGCHEPPRQGAGRGRVRPTGSHSVRRGPPCGLYRPVSISCRLCLSRARGGSADGSPDDGRPGRAGGGARHG